MQEEKIKVKLDEYLKEDKEGKVISINGEWGVGKTRFWKDYIKGTSGYEYAYVSLYGKKNIEEVETDVSIQLSDMQHLVKLAKSKLGGFKKINSFITMLESSNFENVIICFDDFERLDQLNIESVLGLISNLKENKNCRVVMILNEEKIDSDKFSIGKEKIIDYEFLYNPKPEFSLSKTDIQKLTYFKIEQIQNYLEKYEINNIRVLKKIVKALKDIEEHVEEYKSKKYFDELLENILHDVLPYLYVYYKFNFKDFDKLFSYSQSEKMTYYEDGDSSSGVEENQLYEEYLDYFHSKRTVYKNQFHNSLLYYFLHGYFNNKKIENSLSLRNNVTAKIDYKKSFYTYMNSLIYNFNSDFKTSSEEMQGFLETTKNFIAFIFSNLRELRDKFLILKKVDSKNKEYYETIFLHSSIKYLDYYKEYYPENFFDVSFLHELEDIEEIQEHLKEVQKNLSSQDINNIINILSEENTSRYMELNEFEQSVIKNLTKETIQNILNSDYMNVCTLFDFLGKVKSINHSDYHFLIDITNELLDTMDINEDRLVYLRERIKKVTHIN